MNNAFLNYHIRFIHVIDRYINFVHMRDNSILKAHKSPNSFHFLALPWQLHWFMSAMKSWSNYLHSIMNQILFHNIKFFLDFGFKFIYAIMIIFRFSDSIIVSYTMKIELFTIGIKYVLDMFVWKFFLWLAKVKRKNLIQPRISYGPHIL